MGRRAIECLLVIAIILVTGQLFLPGSNGSLNYFSPDSLKSKCGSDTGLLGVTIPMSLSGYADRPAPLVDHLRAKGYWSPTRATQPRWILTAHTSPDWKDGASWLHRVLYWHDEKWMAWTDANPELAQVVWPQFLASVRRQKSQGEAIELLLLAENATSVEDLQQAVQRSDYLGEELKAAIAASAN